MTGGVVVVLGATGKNFAAGMSGGAAFVWDETGGFAGHVNTERVRLEPLQSERDIEMVQRLLENHASCTNSSKAREVLDALDKGQNKFVKVMPKAYAEAVARLEGEGKQVLPDAPPPPQHRQAQPQMQHQTQQGAAGRERMSENHPNGYLETPRNPIGKRPKGERNRDYDEIYLPMWDAAQLSAQAGRCMDCGVPICMGGCPIGNLIPDRNDLVYEEDWRAALERLHATNNFPEFTGYTCPAPCEKACVLAYNDDPVTIKSVERAVVDKGWQEGWIAPQPPETHTGFTVDVIPRSN